MPFHTSTHMHNIPYNNHHGPGPPQYGNGAGAGGAGSYPMNSSDNDRIYGQYSPDTSHQQSFCPCRTNLSTSQSFIVLMEQLQNTINTLRQYSPHPSNTHCLIYRRIVELNNLMHSGNHPTEGPTSSYDDLSTPTDSEILTPLSASSSHTSFHGSSGASSSHEWHALAAAGYDPYFPMQPAGQHGIYHNIAN